MTARALNPAFRILLPERKPVSNVQQFLVAERESLFGPAVNLDVITLICTYLPSDICCFCQRIHETGRFDCHGCKQESVFCTDTPRMKVKDIKSAACTIPASDVSQFMYNSEGFVCDGCAEDYCFRCIQRGGYGPHKCSVCGDKFIDCCNQDGVCFACSEYELSGGGVVNGHAWFPEAE
ncbi:hypothetical protein BJ741DRAFT_614052 [Chytriomyces cf. hyalinus JEL632]|nr:hypothetical protein BJ741DRAFT_614052 [Chytriomyces cf. hyalinus JEL632]